EEGYEVERTDRETDIGFGADYIIYHYAFADKPKRGGIQLKPNSYAQAHIKNLPSHENNKQRISHFKHQFGGNVSIMYAEEVQQGKMLFHSPNTYGKYRTRVRYPQS